MPQAPRAFFPRSVLLEALVWAGVAASALGAIATHLHWQVSFPRLGDNLLLALAAVLLAWPMRRLPGWSWATALGATWLAALVAVTGVVPAAAVALLVAAAAAVGGRVVGDARPLPALLCGMALIAAAVGWTVSLPIHYWWVHAPLLVLVVALRRNALRSQLTICASGWREAVAASPPAAAASVLMLGVASSAAWLPTLQYDDLAYHLSMPWQLMLHGRYALDPSHQVWVLAPWSGDALQAVAQVVARTEARSALNIAWFAMTAAGLWQLCKLLGVRPALRWAAPALFASLPMTSSLLGGMQTETFASAVTIGLAVLVVDTSGAGTRRLLAGALLFGLLCGLKPLHVIAGLLLAAWAGWRQRHSLPSPLALAWSLLLVVAIGGSSYVQAWIVTGNPVLPLFNSVFLSPWFDPVDFADPNWHRGLDATTLWRMTFDTDAYVEGWDGAMGLTLVALAGAWLLAFRHAPARGLALCATAALLLALLPMQYARYLHPSLVLLLPALVAGIGVLPPMRSAVLVAGLCIANLALQPNAHWILRGGGVMHAVRSLGDETKLFEAYAPERSLAAAIRERAPDTGPVLVLSNPFHAEFAGRGRTVDWYSPRLFTARGIAGLTADGSGWEALLRDEGIAEVILDPTRLTPAQRAGLERVHAHREMAVGGAEWWRIDVQGVEP